MDKPIIFEQFSTHAVITLNRPDVFNALDQEMINELKKVTELLSKCEKTRCVIIKANGKHFMAGGDVKMFASLTMPGKERHLALKPWMEQLHDCMQALSKLPMPIIASVQGAVAGFGLGLMMASDIIIASEIAYFNLAYIKIGLCPDGLVSYWLPRKIGLTKAMELALTGKRLDAKEAMDLGLINHVVKADILDLETSKLVTVLNQNSLLAMRQTKKLLRFSLDNDIKNQSSLELKAFGQCLAHDDFVEGVKAFLEKRSPNFNEKS